MALRVRPAAAADAEACGLVVHDAFRGVADAHGFPPDFPTPEAATRRAASLIAHPSVFAVVAEEDGRVVGCNFLAERDPVRAVGPLAVGPGLQGGGVGRRLMEAVLDRARGASAVRLVGDAFNTRSVALYASLGFEVKEPLLLMRGAPGTAPPPGCAVRAMAEADADACARLCAAVHGFDRRNEVRDAMARFAPFVVERDGRITGYMTAPSSYLANHGVAETDENMGALLAGAAGAGGAASVSLLVPARRAGLFRLCLGLGMRVVKPMALMALGGYREPSGSWFPSVHY